MGIETALLAAGAVSAAAAAASAVSQAQAAKGQAEAMDYNADVIDQNAAETGKQTGAEEAQQRAKAGAVLARGRAAAAEGGVVATTGSVAGVQADAARDAELDALTVRYRGDLARRGLVADAGLRRSEAAATRSAASGALVSGLAGAGSKALATYARYG